MVPERLVELEHVHNLRDLGGYPAADGRQTRWGRLFRADGLYRLSWAHVEGTAADVARVRALGLHTVLDLRTDGELAERGRFPVEQIAVAFHHLPMIDVLWDPDDGPGEGQDEADFLLGQYRWMLEASGPRIAEAFHRLALPGALPAVFHCAAGKDRTGILAALVLAGLGVADEHVVHDYALTAAAMDRTRAWALRTSPEAAAGFASRPAAHHAADPRAMAALLAELHEGFGSVRAYLGTIGVTNAVLYRLEDELLVPAAASAA